MHVRYVVTVVEQVNITHVRLSLEKEVLQLLGWCLNNALPCFVVERPADDIYDNRDEAEMRRVSHMLVACGLN